MQRRFGSSVWVAAGLVSLLTACSGDDGGAAAPVPTNTQTNTLPPTATETATATEVATTTPTPDPANAIEQALTSVQSAGVAALRMSGAPPIASGGPAVTAESLSAAILGGTAQVRLNSASDFVRAYISVVGLDGFFAIDLPAASQLADLQITLGQTAPALFECVYRIEAADGSVGEPIGVMVEPIEVGTGEVQVSVSWDTLSDVDLHVVEPNGEEIFFANAVSATGGELDLDSNAACNIDGLNNENITWGMGSTPGAGEYIVRVDYWSNCGLTATTNYTVTVQVGGQLVGTFSGAFAPQDADGGGPGSGRTITTFTVGS